MVPSRREKRGRDDREKEQEQDLAYNPDEVVKILLSNGVTLDVEPATFQEEWVVSQRGRVELFRFQDGDDPTMQVVGETSSIVAIWTRKLPELEPTPTEETQNSTS